MPSMPPVRALLSVIAAGMALSATESAVAGKGDIIPSGITPACQNAYRTMLVCRDKMMAAGAPPAARLQWDKQLDDSVKMWRAFRGKGGVEESCQAIAKNPDCND